MGCGALQAQFSARLHEDQQTECRIVNMILNTDSYKYSHYAQYPPETSAISAYVESRPGGRHDQVLFFGLQMFLKEYLTRRITLADIDEADELVTAHGLPFNGRHHFLQCQTDHCSCTGKIL